MHRRDFVKGVGGTAAGSLLAAPAVRAQGTWPDKPVKVIVPYAAGGGTDIMARPWMEKLSQVMGQQFVIENRGGASGMIGTEAVAKSAPDGYTLLFTPNNTLDILPLLRKVPYEPLKSFDPVARVGDMVCGFVVHPAVGIKTFAELLDHAKKNPGKLAYGSSGLGTATHMRVEMLKIKTGVNILHVPYRGGADALTDVLANNAQMMNESSSLPHVRAGKLTMLNINHVTRSPEYPDLPTLTELGYPGADVPIWFSLWAPAGTPKDIREKIAGKLVELGKAEELAKRISQAGYAPLVQTLDDLTKHLVENTQINQDLIKSANIKLE